MSCWENTTESIKDFFSGVNVPEDIMPDTPTLPTQNEPNEDVDKQVPTQNPNNDTSTCKEGLPCERSIDKAYFATKKTIQVPVGNGTSLAKSSYTIKSGDSLSKIAKKYKGVSYKDIAKENGISAPKYNISVGQKLIIPNQVATEEKVIYQKISRATLGAKVFLVVDTKGFKKGQSVNIKIYEKEKMLVPANKELPFLKGTTQQTEVMAVVKIDPKTNKQQAVVEINLRPKVDKKADDKINAGSLEAWKEKFGKGQNDKEEKKDFLWLKVSDLQGKVDEKEFLKGGELVVSNCAFDWANTPLIKLIISKESKGSYDAYNITGWNSKGKNKIYESHFSPSAAYTVSNMTIKEIKAAQTTMVGLNKKHMFAVGLYQCIPKTLASFLKWLANYQNITETTQLFDKTFQDKFPWYFWESKRRTISKYFKGESTVEAAAYAISKEWASAAAPKGYKIASGKVSNGETSYYGGDGLNKAHYNANKTIKALKDTKLLLDQCGGYNEIRSNSLG